MDETMSPATRPNPLRSPRLRARAFDWDRDADAIRASGNSIPPHQQAGHMTAGETSNIKWSLQSGSRPHMNAGRLLATAKITKPSAAAC